MDSDAQLSASTPRIIHLVVITLAVVALALVMRLWGLSSEPAWLDEVYSVLLSDGSAGQILEVNAKDVHPPAYYLGLGSWRDDFGSTPAGIRSYSVLWSLFGVIFVVLLAAAAGLDWRGVSLAGLLAAINPLDIFFAQEARMYAQAAALGTASTWMLWHWLINRQEEGSKLAQGIWLALYACTAALLLQTLYLGIFILLAQGLFVLTLLATRRDTKGCAAYIGTSLVASLLFLPWMVFLQTHGPHRLGRLDWIPAPPISDFLSPFYREFFIGRMVPSGLVYQILLIVSASLSIAILLTLVGTRQRQASQISPATFFVSMTCVPLVLAFLASHLIRPVYFRVRFPILVLPFFLVLIAIVAMRLPRRSIRQSFLLLVLAVMGIAAIFQHRQITKPGMAQFADLYQRSGPPDHVVLFPPGRTITASYELGFPLTNSDQQQIEQSLARGHETVIWVAAKEGYLDTADPRVKRVYDWLLALGPNQQLETLDKMEIWQITVEPAP